MIVVFGIVLEATSTKKSERNGRGRGDTDLVMDGRRRSVGAGVGLLFVSMESVQAPCDRSIR